MSLHADTRTRLFFYSLAGSPMADDSRSRKGLLRYHQPPESSAPSYYLQYAYLPPPVPFAIHSASTSPHHSSVTLPPVLPSNATVSWSRNTAAPTISHDPSYTRGGEVQESSPCLREAMNGGPIRVSADALVNVPFLYIDVIFPVMQTEFLCFGH